jgi:hypothetical protein
MICAPSFGQTQAYHPILRIITSNRYKCALAFRAQIYRGGNKMSNLHFRTGSWLLAAALSLSLAGCSRENNRAVSTEVDHEQPVRGGGNAGVSGGGTYSQPGTDTSDQTGVTNQTENTGMSAGTTRSTDADFLPATTGFGSSSTGANSPNAANDLGGPSPSHSATGTNNSGDLGTGMNSGNGTSAGTSAP